MNSNTSEIHKFSKYSGMTRQGVFHFAFRMYLIPILQNLHDEFDASDFLEALVGAATRYFARKGHELAESVSSNDMATWTAWMDDPRDLFNCFLIYDIIERTDRVCEIRVTECLWAKTFREAGASDIGYAVCCAGDWAMCQAFNPKMHLTRTKTLMQGDDCCNYRWELED
jgi:hypothetical protein